MPERSDDGRRDRGNETFWAAADDGERSRRLAQVAVIAALVIVVVVVAVVAIIL